MTEQQLYIDGVLMDVTEDTKITLDIKSNLFRDVTKMESNNTYTVQLPKTVHNLSVMGMADVPKSDSSFPFVLHTCRYLRGGVEIIKSGRVALLGVKETIEITILWGLFPAFTTLQDEDLALNDLKTEEHVLFGKSNVAMGYSEFKKAGVGYASYNPFKVSESTDDWNGYSETVTESASTQASDGFGSSTPSYFPIHPSVTCKWLLSLIASQTGVTFSFDKTSRNYIYNLAIPLVGKKADEKTLVGTVDATINDTSSLGALTFKMNDTISSIKQQIGYEGTELMVTAACALTFDVEMTWSWDASKAKPQGSRSWTDADGTEHTEYVYSYYGNYIEMKVVSKHTEGDDESSYTTVYNVGAASKKDDGTLSSQYLQDLESAKVNGRFIHKIVGNGKVELAEGDVVTFEMKNSKGRLLDLRCYDGIIKASLEESDEVPFGGMFPIGINLPDIKVLDFVKFLSLMTGTFPRQLEDGGKVQFVPYSTIWENRGKAVDWSLRLIPRDWESTPREISYSVDGYCKRNNYKWKDDDTVKGDYGTYLTIDNETLEDEQDVWTLPFAASDGNRVPMYEARSATSGTFGGGAGTSGSSSSNSSSYSSCKDRIMTLGSNDEGKAILSFGIDLGAIFDEKYEKLTKTVSKPHVITEYMYLSDLDLMGFDETVPVYLRQYGAYFAVTEIKASDNGYSEVTMIQLEF